MRDSLGRFVKGAKLDFNSKENRTEVQKTASIKNLQDYTHGSKHRIGLKHPEGAKEKMSDSHTKNISKMTERDRKERYGIWKGFKGRRHPNYIEDRTKLKREDRRNDSAYGGWRRDVYERDNWTCRINNEDCDGRIEAHHILSWRGHEELRYDINNGITLCHFHHPRGVKEEKRLIPELQELVSVSSE